MRIVRSHSQSGVSLTRSREERALQSLAALLWETVARIADGRSPDGEDRAVIDAATIVLTGQRDMLNYVIQRAAAPAPTTALRGTDTLVDLIWIAADQLGATEILEVPRNEGIEVILRALDDIKSGDQVAANRWDPLFGRVAMLVESSGNGAALTY